MADDKTQPNQTADKPAPAAKPLRVRATARGFYGGSIREIGDVFVVDSERAVSKRWMEPSPKAGA